MTPLPTYYEYYNPVKIVSGHKALDSIPYELEQLNVKNPIIVTDKGVDNAGLIKLLINAFAESDITIGALYSDTPPDSSIETVNDIVKIYRENLCDSIIAVGGGSAIDTAKGVNIVITENEDDISKFMGAEMLKKNMQPLIVVPTTSGTGSEVTLVAVINDPIKSLKMPFTSYKLLPNVAVLDPRMTLTLPPKLTAATAMDALTHAIEAYTCLQKNPISDAHATAAIELIRDNLMIAIKNGKDVSARFALANASCMAGAAFSNSMVGMIHSLGHATGGVAHIPHGIAMSIFLPYGLEYNMPSITNLIGDLLLYIAGPDVFASTPKGQRAKKTIDSIRNIQKQLKNTCGLPTTLAEAGVQKDQLKPIAQTAINDGSLIFNPEEMNFDEALEILTKAYGK